MFTLVVILNPERLRTNKKVEVQNIEIPRKDCFLSSWSSPLHCNFWHEHLIYELFKLNTL